MNERGADVLRAKKTIREQRSYFSNKQLSALDFHRDDPNNVFLIPDLSSLRPDNITEIRRGAGFTVFRVNKDKVIKVEQVVIRKDPKTGAMSTHYPWMALGMDRHALISDKAAVERRRIHLENKKRLESVGIKTANYVGSMIIPSLPASVSIPAMYAEVWENVKGVPLEKDERAVDQLYKTPEGRGILKQLALSLLKLSKQGYVCDVDQSYYQTNTAARTKKNNPFPRNFFLRKGEGKQKGELVAYDFNMGIDLTKEPWWKKEFGEVEPLMRSKIDGRIYASHDLIMSMQKSMESMFYEPSYVVRGLNKDDYKRLYRSKEEKSIFASQIGKLYGQIKVSAAILAKIEEITGVVDTSIAKTIPS